VRELASLLNDFGLDVVAQTELGVESAEETGLTFIENAILKAPRGTGYWPARDCR
jgi:XTP/dITP diphosphohydrolase